MKVVYTRSRYFPLPFTLAIHIIIILKFSLQEQSTSLFNHSDLHQENFYTTHYGSSVEFPAFSTNNPIAMDNWNSGDVTPAPSNWGNNFTPTQQNFGGIGRNYRHNSGYSNQAGISGSYQPNLDPFPQCSNSRQIYQPEYASSSSGTDSSSLELPDLYPPSMPMQPASQSRDVLPRDVYNQLTPDQKQSREKKLSVKRSTKYNERKKNERESLEIQVALEENTNQILTREYKQILKQRDIMEKATTSLRNRNGNIF